MIKRGPALIIALLCAAVFMCACKGEPKAEEISFTDVAPEAWYSEYVTQAAQLGLFSGYEDGSFMPEEPITNAESVKLAAIAAGMEPVQAAEGEDWFAPYVRFAEEKGLMPEYEGGDWFYLDATRESFACLLARAAGPERLAAVNTVDDGAIYDYVRGFYDDEVYALYRAGIAVGDGTTGAFRPRDTLTRAEAAAMLCRLADPEARVSTTLTKPQAQYVRYDTVPVLMYHEVNDNGYGDLYLSTAHFEEHLDYLAENGYNTVTLSQLYEHWYENKPLPEKPIVLTFDDGYRTMYTEVMPRLVRAGCVGTFFVVPAARWSDWSMDADMFAQMTNYGMEIASHTYNHVELDSLSQAEIIEELTSSKTVIEELTGAPVISICYPCGAYNGTVLAEAENAGYLIGVTTNFEPTKPEQGRFSLSRLRIGYGCDAQELEAMLAGIYN